jgi:hypothetical protein
MTATDAERIAAEGVPLTLRDGRSVHLRYSMRSLFEMEKRWGAIDNATTALNDLLPDADGEKAKNRKPVSTVVPLLALGLVHEGITEDDLLDQPLLHLHELANGYLDVIAEALNQAFPSPERPGKGVAAAGNGTAPTGPASTTPPPSALVAASASSGA